MSYGAMAASSSSSSKQSRHDNILATSSDEAGEVFVPSTSRNTQHSTLLLALKTAAIVFLFAGLSVLGVSMSNSYSKTGVSNSKMSSSRSFLDEATDSDSGRVTYSLLTTDQTLSLFDDFITTYNRDYAQDADEYNKRLMVFRSNLDTCDDRNAKESLAGGTAVHGVTRFSDLTTEEFSTVYLMEDQDDEDTTTTKTTKTTTTTTTTTDEEDEEDEDEDEDADEDEEDEKKSKDEEDEEEEDASKSSRGSGKSKATKKSSKKSSKKSGKNSSKKSSKKSGKNSSKKSKGKRELMATAIRERVRLITAKHDAIIKTMATSAQRRLQQQAKSVFSEAAQRTRRLSDPTIKYQDWSDDYTTDVKNSGSCAGSWAIAAAEQIESDGIIGGVITVNDALSAQQILSCTDGQDGCSGGSLEDAIAYVQKPGGLFKTADYAWSSNDGVVEECDVPTKPYTVTVGGVFELNTDDIATNTERLMVQRLSNTGTLAACMDATVWSTYVSGTIQNCDKNTINHCAQIVGVYYSSAEDSGFYKIRNHWGTDWGIDGYISIAYGSDMCGIAYNPLYTDVVGSDAAKVSRRTKSLRTSQ